jgi:small subunit ribosomal protein S4
MARYTDAICRQCRREGTKLFLKGDRCFSEKCAVERRNYPEKQKVKRMYGLLEAQFRKTMATASRMKGRAGENLLSLLERRLDNVVFRLGFATSRAEARQLVQHGHFLIDGRKANIPSLRLKAGQRIALRERSRKISRIIAALEVLERRSIPGWLELDKDNFEGTLKALPAREDITMPIQEQLIVELHSR